MPTDVLCNEKAVNYHEKRSLRVSGIHLADDLTDIWIKHTE